MAKVTTEVGILEIKALLMKGAPDFKVKEIHFPNVYVWFNDQGFHTDEIRTRQEIAEAIDSLIKEGKIIVVGIASSADLFGAAVLHFNI